MAKKRKQQSEDSEQDYETQVESSESNYPSEDLVGDMASGYEMGRILVADTSYEEPESNEDNNTAVDVNEYEEMDDTAKNIRNKLIANSDEEKQFGVNENDQDDFLVAEKFDSEEWPEELE